MLTVGDIAIIGLQADTPDAFSFVALGPIGAGEEIFFTDNGVFSDGSFRANEGVLKWTAPGDIAAGTVITYIAGETNPDFTSESGSFALSTGGDQIIAYQVDDADNTTFLYAVQGDSTGFQSAPTNSNTTALPPGLELGVSAVVMGAVGGEVDNGFYSGSASGTKEELLALIANAENWTTSNSALNFDQPDSFDVTDGTTGLPSFAITEIWPGQKGSDVTEDWFEIRNTSTVAWSEGEHGPLYYDDESADATEAVRVDGLTGLAPGETAIVVVGKSSDAAAFRSVWEQSIDLTGVQIGHADGAGLGGDEDTVNIWLGDPLEGGVLAATARYENADSNDGASFDVTADAYSVAGENGAVATVPVAGSTGDVPAVGSPGDGAAVNNPATGNIVISEIMYNPASAEDDWEWVEITNTGSAAVDLTGWVIDDGNNTAHGESNIAAATLAAGASAVLYNGDDISAEDFAAAWGQQIQLIAVSNWNAMALNNSGDMVSLWSSFADYEGDQADHQNAVVTVDYDDGGAWPADNGSASIYLTDLAANANDGQNWALSTDGGNTPVNVGKTAKAEGGNSGADVGSPGGLDLNTVAPPEASEALTLNLLGRTEISGAEIVDFDPTTDRAFVSSSAGINVVNAADPNNLSFVQTVAPADSGASANDVTSVSVKNGILAAAVPGADPLQPGQVFFYDSATLAFLGSVTVGALPDMVTFDSTGNYLLVANEAQSAGGDNQPGVTPNPEGSVSVIKIDANDLSNSAVTTLGFTDASLTEAALRAKGVRLDSSAPSVAADIEPEYITIDGTTAYIALQENNAVAVIEDITNPSAFTIDDIVALGTKDHSAAGNELDASNRDGGINITNYDIRGLYMPDGIASFSVDGERYFITANEGDGRKTDEARGADLVDGDLANGEVDANMDAALRAQLADDAALGRLKFSTIDGDTDGDGDIDVLHSFGARSFTIFDADGNVVFDSGSQFAAITASVVPAAFNSKGDADSFDSRSDDKGAEPESVVVGQVGDATYAFVGLERVGGVMVYDVTDPENAEFVNYVRTDGDVAPEGLKFVSAEDSPTGSALLGVASEGSGTLTFYDLEPVVVEPEITLISEIQGAGDSSDMVGETVTVEAIVTASFLEGLSGFFVQEQEVDYDDNALTSEGIFIYAGDLTGFDFKIGDLVQVTGTVSEFRDKTQISISSEDAVAVLDSDQLLPSATEIEFGPGLTPNLEAVESMRVTIEEMVVTEMYQLDRFGQIRVADERLEQFTQNNAPDAEGYAAHVQDVEQRTIILDDGNTAGNPFEMRIPDGDDYKLTSADEFRMGDKLQDITGVMDFAFGDFRIQAPTAVHVQSNPRPESPQELDGNFKVASLNVLNYFTTLNDADNLTSVGKDPRGANTEQELERQTTKIVKAITEMDADIIGLIEIENDVDSAPLAALTAAVNAALGAEVYGFINTGQVGDDAITNAIMYKIATANPVGVTDILDDDSFVDPLNSPRDGLNRPAVTQSFEHIQSGEVLTVSVNHLKSKGSLSGLAADENQNDGQGNNNATRTEAAKVLADHLATDPTGVGDGDVLIIGDMNAYAQEDPITALRDKGYSDIAYDNLGEDAYSYVFDGQVGTLDYILGTGGILDKVRGVTEWHINADEADAVDYQVEIRNNSGTTTFATRDTSIFDGDTAARNSDHDPVIVSFQFDREYNLVMGTEGRDRLVGTDGADRIESLGGRYDRMTGGEGPDQFVFGAETRNGIRERDVITDFNAAEDQIVLAGGTEILAIRESSFGVSIYFEGDRDAVQIRTPGLTKDDLTIVIEDDPLVF